MALNSAIRAERLSKSYLVGHGDATRDKYLALRDVLGRSLRDLTRRTKDMLRGRPIVPGSEVEEFWALRDVTFDLGRGDRIGIIGRNGAGKSTLLKILSRITEPTEGRVEICGRVASLLEVGTGFHPELTGRENIFLNGAIIGMSRAEILRRFDEIVAFAEVERFLDTPVKRYSSGMYVRLAFAVAAHLEPEILIVDEVLAVGDSSFQAKCLGRMRDVGRDGRTVLFVSHNMGAIRSLCDSAICLDGGRIVAQGSVDSVLNAYVSSTLVLGSASEFDVGIDRRSAHFTSVRVLNAKGEVCTHFQIGDTISFEMRVCAPAQEQALQLSFIVRSGDGRNIYHCLSQDIEFALPAFQGLRTVVATFRDLRLYPGSYVINDVWLARSDGETIDLKKDCASFVVLEGGSRLRRRLALHAGTVLELPEWHLEDETEHL